MAQAPAQPEAAAPPKEEEAAPIYSKDEDPDSPEVLTVGCILPNFEIDVVLPKSKTEKRHFKDFRGKFLVLFSYPLNYIPISSSEVIAFEHNHERFEEIDCQIMGFSCESIPSLVRWTNTPRAEGGVGNLSFPLGSDGNARISKKMGFYLEEAGCPLRGTMIVDPDGAIKHISKNDPSASRSVEETIRLVKAFQFAKAHGEMCPAMWQEGAEAISPSEGKKYFSRHYQ